MYVMMCVRVQVVCVMARMVHTGGVCHGTHWSEDNFQDTALAFPFIEAGALAVSAVGHT